jgi:hypothetical protein
LWPDSSSKDKSSTMYVDTRTIDNIEASAQRLLMALNYCDFFAGAVNKAFKTIRKGKSTSVEAEAAMDLADRVRKSMGRCLEAVVQQQAYVLTAATAIKRDHVLKQHKSSLQESVTQWLRAQPVLSATSLFGPVADKARPLLKEHRERPQTTGISVALKSLKSYIVG